jgi:hypothetical protein
MNTEQTFAGFAYRMLQAVLPDAGATDRERQEYRYKDGDVHGADDDGRARTHGRGLTLMYAWMLPSRLSAIPTSNEPRYRLPAARRHTRRGTDRKCTQGARRAVG